MEPLSAAGSVISVLHLASEVFKYVNTAASASKERKRLRSEVLACRNILQQLQDDVDDSEEGKAWLKTIKVLEAPDGPLGRLRVALDVVKIKLMSKDGLRNSLKWPFKEREVQKIIGAIEREKSLLELALANNSRKLLQEITKRSRENGWKLNKLTEIVKSGQQDNRNHFEELKSVLSGTMRRIDGLYNRHDNQQATEENEGILEWLTTADYTSQQQDYLSRRHAGTGEWFLNSAVYQSWLKADKKTLFCPGIPGAGKTILTAIMVDDAFEQYGDDPTVGLAYLYCNFRRQEQQTLSDLLASLLKQLAKGRRPVSRIVKDLFDRHEKKETRPSLEDISKALQLVVASYSKAFIIIDAVDECQEVDGCRAKLLSEIFTLQEKSNLHFLATSRFIPEITERFRESASIEIHANSEDVRKYLDGQMYQLPTFVSGNSELQEEIKNGIVHSVHGMYVTDSQTLTCMRVLMRFRFLLAQLHLNSLIGKKSPKALRAALEKLPSGSEAYDRAYKRAMKRIEGQVADQKELAKQVLSWITCATRPLTTLELQHALGVEVGELKLDEENFSQVEDMVSSCAGLVTVDEESDIIRLVHYTAQEYFRRTQEYWFPGAETEITKACVTYLSFSEFQKGPCSTDKDFEDRLQRSALYDYAAHNWGHHARVASSMCIEVIDFLGEEEKVAASSQAMLTRKWGPSYSDKFPRKMTGLHLAAYFGIEDLISTLHEQSFGVDMKNTFNRTPLSYAAENGYVAVVKLLLDKNAAAQSLGYNRRTPLYYAARNGHEDVVKLLLDADATVDSQNTLNRTPLSYAAWNGHEAVVKLLLEKDAAIDSQNQSGRTPLSYAAWSGHETVVKLLLDNGAAVDSRDQDNRTPLWYAARNGHEFVVKLLLDKGASVDTHNRDRRTSLSCAAEDGHNGLVKLLLNKSAAVHSQNKFGRTPLSFAAGNGHEAVVKHLLDNDAVVDSRNKSDRTPLSYAAWNGHEAVVKLLLSKNASVDSRSQYGRTALSYASANGHEAVVKLLLHESADIDARDQDGWSPLWYAVENGHEAVVKLLLNKNAAVGSRDQDIRTPLSYAAENGHGTVVQLLLDIYADVDTKDRDRRTPLSYAAENGHGAVVKLLLDKNAAIDTPDRFTRTPLSYAAENRHEPVIKLLLDKKFCCGLLESERQHASVV
jgi:ankyrin repeat protein